MFCPPSFLFYGGCVIKIKFPVSEDTKADIKESAKEWNVKKDAIMRAAVDQALHDGLNPHFFEVLRNQVPVDRILVRLCDGAYSEVSTHAEAQGVSRAVYAAACILQSLSRGLVGSFVDEATFDLGRPETENAIKTETNRDEPDSPWNRQVELWALWREWQWANGDEEEDAEMLMHA
jgi:hypothetical protein